MATAPQFQLFPPPPPKVNASTNPIRKPATVAARKNNVAKDSLVKSPTSESVIIQIIEEPENASAASGVAIIHSRSQSPDSAHQITSSSPIGGHEQARKFYSPQPTTHAVPSLPVGVRAQARDTSSPIQQFTRSGSATLVRGGSLRSDATSPVVPMRSMFPTFNPNLPLNKQRYYPQRPAPVETRRQNVSRDDYVSSAVIPSRLDAAVGGPKTAPASVMNFPADCMALEKPRVSSVQELERLWEATSGCEPDSAIAEYDLAMSRHNEATFSFGPTPSQPFYTFQTYDTNEITISRTNPRQPTIDIPILHLNLEAFERRLTPHDGLVTFIFPKLAAMMAIDQSAELAALHQLAPSERDQMQEEAIQRAAAQEACRLFWNETDRRYELAHPAIGQDPEAEVLPPIPPAMAQGHERKVLHITVSTHALASPTSSTAAPPVIFVTNPQRPSMNRRDTMKTHRTKSTTPRIRMSTIPTTDTDEPLASLDLGSMILQISADQILQQLPSLYSIDSIVSAIFAVAVADEVTNPILARMRLWRPRPRAPASIHAGSIAGRSYTGSVLYATLAEREEAEQEAKLMKQVHEKDVQVDKAVKKSFWAKKQKTKKKTKKITVAEYDLEKFSKYQSGSREGEELPGFVTGFLELLFLGLRFVVWALSAVVQSLSCVIVAVTRTLTSEKF